MTAHRFSQVDVFAASPFGGNPVAVIHDAEALSSAEMAAISRWTNLSETTFLLPAVAPGADYRLRIFTPSGELPFAGHPTLGSAHAWLEAGGAPATAGHVVQECGAGLVPVRLTGGDLAFRAPPLLRSGPVDAATLTRAVHGLGATHDVIRGHHWVDNGPGFFAIEVPDVQTLADLRPLASRLDDLAVGAFAFTAGGAGHLYEVRAFFPKVTDCEDPVTGSLNAGIAKWLHEQGRVPDRYTVRQGMALGRDGLVQVAIEGDDVWIGGATRTAIAGTLTAR